METCSTMEYFHFCLKVLKKEEDKFNVKLSSADIAELTYDVNFDVVYNRCAYMYKYATCTLHFVHDCINKFLSECESVNNIVLTWMLSSNLKLCSISFGPGLEYFALLLAFAGYDCFKVQPLFKSVKIVSKYGAWRNTLNLMLEAIVEGSLSNLSSVMMEKEIEVIQGDPYVMLSQRMKEVVQESDVIMMVKTLNLPGQGPRDETSISSSLMELFTAMKPESVLFCIDTKPSCALFIECLSKFTGTFLFEPTHITGKLPTTFPEAFKEIYGHFPTLSARGSYFVWKKLNGDLLFQNVVSPCSNNSLLADYVYHQTDSNFCNISLSSNSSVLNDQLDEEKLKIKTGNASDVIKSVVQDECCTLKAIQGSKENPFLQSENGEISKNVPLTNSILTSDSVRHSTSPPIMTLNKTFQSENQKFTAGNSVSCNLPLLKPEKSKNSENVPLSNILNFESVSSHVTLPENEINDKTFQSENDKFLTVNNSMRELVDQFKSVLNVSQKLNLEQTALRGHSCSSLDKSKSPNKKKQKVKEPRVQADTFIDQSVQVSLPISDHELKNTDIKSLTSRIEMLTSSFEELLMQKSNKCFNVKETHANENTEMNDCLKSNRGMINDCRIYNEKLHAKCGFNNASACDCQRRDICGTSNYARQHACQSINSPCSTLHSAMQNCSFHCHGPHMCNSRTHGCLYCPSSSSNVSPAPNIVIPLENVNSDVLCQIIALLKKP